MSHWYDTTGEPRHFEGKDGKATTLREARKLELYPSVTTVLGIVDKYNLNLWMQREVAKIAAEHAMSGYYAVYDDEFANEVIKAHRETVAAKADDGTDIHGILESYFSGDLVDSEHMELCQRVNGLIVENTGREDWIAEQRFCDTELGYAGMCDLHNDAWVIDFKTRDTVSDKDRGWPEQACQLAAYAHGLGVPDARIANVFIGRDDGNVCFYEHKDDTAWLRFLKALELWQVTKKYGPLYEEMVK